MVRFSVGKPSPSNGRDPYERTLWGSSTRDVPLGKMGFPSSLLAHEAPWTIARPFIALSKCPIKLLEIRSSKSTGKFPVLGFLEFSFLTARSPAVLPISSGDIRSLLCVLASPKPSHSISMSSPEITLQKTPEWDFL